MVSDQERSMSMKGPNEIPSKASRGKPKAGFLGLLRAVALIAVVAGAGGSLVYMLRAGQRTPRLLLILFIFWVLSPFVPLIWGNIVSKRWPVLTRVTLYCVTLIIALGSLAIYGERIVLRPPGSANAFLFVAVPPVSLLFITIAVAMAAFISGRLSRRRDVP
jgi:hypothetical protein